MSTVNFEGIIHTLAAWRRRGSTTVAARAAGNYGDSGTLVVHDARFVDYVKEKHGTKHVLSLQQFADYRGGQMNGPVVIDHWVLVRVAQEGLRYQSLYESAEAERKRLQTDVSLACVELSIRADHAEVDKLRSFNDSYGLLQGIKEVVKSRNHYRDQREVQATALRAIRDAVNMDTTYEEIVKEVTKVIDSLEPKKKKVEGAPS